MFGLFKPKFHQDPTLGEFRRRGRQWTGTISLLGGAAVELELDGTREAPFPQALAAAYELPTRMKSLIPQIAAGLLEHLEPYQDALLDPKTRGQLVEEFPDDEAVARIEAIKTADQAWSAARIVGVEIGPEDDKSRLLLKFETLWDIEHQLGAYFDDWEFLELNGSV